MVCEEGQEACGSEDRSGPSSTPGFSWLPLPSTGSPTVCAAASQPLLEAAAGGDSKPGEVARQLLKVVWTYWPEEVPPRAVAVNVFSWRARNPGYVVRLLNPNTVKCYLDDAFTDVSLPSPTYPNLACCISLRSSGYYLLLATRGLLLAACYSRLATRCLRLAACYSLIATHY